MSDGDVREAARAEVLGYWRWAARRPWTWLDPVVADLGLTSMARARHTLATGELLSKTRAVEQADAPGWLRDQLRARRRGASVRSPRLRTAALAWRDARRTLPWRDGHPEPVRRSACRPSPGPVPGGGQGDLRHRSSARRDPRRVAAGQSGSARWWPRARCPADRTPGTGAARSWS